MSESGAASIHEGSANSIAQAAHQALAELGDSVRVLEARIADATARGDTVPAAAYDMLTTLRALMSAVQNLSASLGNSGSPASVAAPVTDASAVTTKPPASPPNSIGESTG